MVSVEATAAQAASAFAHGPMTSASPALLNLTSLKATAANVTSAFSLPFSIHPIFRFPLRLTSRIDRTLLHIWSRFILEGLGTNSLTRAGTATGAGIAGTQAMADAAAQPAVAQALGETGADSWANFFSEAFQATGFKSYWGMLHYLTSRWAFTCFVVALILNRISVYGASRQRIQLTWTRRLALRIVPIVLFITQIHQLLQAIRCQTSPDFSLYRHGDNNKYSLLDWSTDGGWLHILTSTLLFRSTDAQACAAIGMSRPSPEVRAPFGSFSLLWPSFLRLSLSHVVENLSCSLQQIPTTAEVGMSVFEHSLAFAEAETMISHTLGLGYYGSSKSPSSGKANITSPRPDSQPTIPASGTILALADATATLTGPHLLDRVNVPVEILLVALLSCCNSLSSHVIAVLGKQRQWRLMNTGIWAMTFMAAFVWGFSTTSVMVRSGDNGDRRPVSSLLHFPTVAIIGFLPHMVILAGIAICLLIYLVALTLTAVSLGTNPQIPRPTTLKERFIIAHDNLQAAVQTRGIEIRWHEDFYTTLLRSGFAALTAASEAVFLNEGRAVEVRQFTWLEEDRLDEFDAAMREMGPFQSAFPNSQQFQILEEYGLPPSRPGAADKGGVWESGYSKERKLDKKENEAKDSFVYPTPRAGGVGAVQRTTRFYLLMIYVRGIIFLVAGYIGFGIGVLLDTVGITARPRWLRRIVGRSLKRMNAKPSGLNSEGMLDFWILSEDGKLTIASSDEVDIEPEMKRRLMTEFPGERIDELLDTKLYEWWKSGGWFGTKDDSGDYQPSNADDCDDTTSVISTSTEASTHNSDGDEENAWESEPDGSRTPTQSSTGQSWSFSGVVTRESTPAFTDSPLDAATLARLLNPPDRESREEARILASHLATVPANSPGVMTRSRYRREIESERARILLAGRSPAPATSNHHRAPTISLYQEPQPTGPRPLTPIEEAEVLESLILNRRRKHAPPVPPPQSGTPDTGNPDQDRQYGPPCVVCQNAPRTIIAWPCRCLCVCEDCRVSLAWNNFGSCVTCRRTVQGFVRLYVP
ncbi:uncharacterized protein Z519_11523 [Cladophialophora bantiana CBS 173.52]|uniref:RING-type domain-containing protein n=1 Tax=Cladophialophora bantiana (strain ATCC 10958 / CBS 173.52 / CDC B-1940 / NIH 8579) TaxID=1442370 RepID=A0A0D2H3P8_CLAB1|nr:uncharacterized protein Z519_11523 [Cladophialophora bantiana CBS 173.52]KIW87938.1 hypothetical protein Z519_11523 [Cladophialophora bantiana CBS 173.52]